MPTSHTTPSRRAAREIRAALTGADRAEYERDYQAALAQAGEQYDLEPPHDLVEQWWHVAVLTADLDARQRMLDTAAALRSGKSQPGTPWSAVRAGLDV